MQRHTLKCDPVPFQALVDGVKTFEFRKDDRYYKVDDVLVLQETALPRREVQEGVAMQLTGRSIDRRITYVLRSLNSDYEVPQGYCILAVVPAYEGEPADQLSDDSGKHGGYYDIRVMTPLKGLQQYTASCIDLICTLRMTFEEGEAFKAIWRKAADRLGLGKADHDPVYDAEKVAFYGNVMEKLERGRK